MNTNKGDNRYIGIFDSGAGGLSLLKEALKYLPQENFLYMADNLNSPYGSLSDLEIVKHTVDCVDFLIKSGCKCVIIACNTATAAAAQTVRRMFSVPIFGLEPAVKPAIAQGYKKILLLATEATLRNRNYFFQDIQIHTNNCEGLASLIEKNFFNDQAILSLFNKIWNDYKFEGIDCVVLGCTHYILKKELIKKQVFTTAKLYDGNLATVKNIMNTLQKSDLLNTQGHYADVQFVLTKQDNSVIEKYKKILSLYKL